MKKIIAFVFAASVLSIFATDTSDEQKNLSMFEHHIETQVEIKTTEVNAWRVLMAFENYFGTARSRTTFECSDSTCRCRLNDVCPNYSCGRARKIASLERKVFDSRTL